jgi:ubiquinone/menaquinone biosynthesis C-methylase UbiE
LLEALLRCPTCDSELTLGPDAAVCTSGHGFDVVDDVVILVDEATLASDPQYEGQRRYFDAEFKGYSRYTLENWRRSYLDRLRAAGLLDGSALIDVGVGGSGYTVIEAARSGSAAGCDLSLQGLATARTFAAGEGVSERTIWVCCSAERLPFASGSFAAAVAIAVLEHVPDDRAALNEIARVLQPGGRAWVTVPHALRHVTPLLRPLNRRHDRRMGHLRRYEAEQLLEEGRRAGLEPLDVQFTAHPVKALQLALARFGDRLWWFCERRDLRRAHTRRGAMHISVLFERNA